MALIVAKFGGTSVADVKRIERAADKIAAEVARGHQVAVVVSAMAGVTNQLIEYCREVSPMHDAREYDSVVSNGENITSGLMAMALQKRGIMARSWQGWQVPIKCNDVHGKARIVGMAQEELGADFDVGTHFTPSYNPWDQRLCLVPDGDLFKSIKAGEASVVTDTIDTFTETGVKLASGETLDADIVVSATGLQLEFMGGADLYVDGQPVEPSSLHGYRGIMFNNVPNLVVTFGYTNASWTLKADLIAKFVSRLIKYMDKTGAVEVRPIADQHPGDAPWLDFSSGYVTRALHRLPKQGQEAPWRLNQNYVQDIFEIGRAKLDDGVLRYRKQGDAAFETPPETTLQPLAAE